MWAEEPNPEWHDELVQYKAAAKWLECSVLELIRDPSAMRLLPFVEAELYADYLLADAKRKDAEGISDL